MVRPLGLALVLSACSRQAPLPAGAPSAAELGRCQGSIEAETLCRDWSAAVAGCQGAADDHASFPELDARSCYLPVRYQPGRLPRPDPIPDGCGYPGDRALTRTRLEREARRYERIARGAGVDLPMAFDCALPADVREAGARSNARTFRALARRFERHGERFPYAAVSTFGFGHGVMSQSELVDWRPGQECLRLDKREMDKLGINRERAGRAAEAYHGGVAPVVTVSGGAVHASLNESFMLHHLLACTFAVPADAVLVDPCADHTHTNLRNTGGLVQALGGRQAYIVSQGFQAAYLQEWTSFSLIGGSIDARALRDWGYLLGSWRQASVGSDAGFWFTPYRFWGEPEEGLGSASCVR